MNQAPLSPEQASSGRHASSGAIGRRVALFLAALLLGTSEVYIPVSTGEDKLMSSSFVPTRALYVGEVSVADLDGKTSSDIDQISASSSNRVAESGRFEAWYVNLRTAVERDVCMHKQLELAQLQPNRYEANVFDTCKDKRTFVDCLKRQGFGDCVQSGIDWEAVGFHGGNEKSSLEVINHIVSNWCSHMRLFSQLMEINNTSQFAIIFEDDAVLNATGLKPEINEFLQAQEGADWDLVVVDPFNTQLDIVTHGLSHGGECAKYEVGRQQGNAIWQLPHVDINAAGHGQVSKRSCDVEQCDFCGAQALLVRKSSLARVVATMESMPVVPLDWLPRFVPRALAWRPRVALNPHGLNLGIPDFCSQKVAVSTIDGLAEDVSANVQDANPSNDHSLRLVTLAGASFKHIKKFYCWSKDSNASDIRIRDDTFLANLSSTSIHDCATVCLGNARCVGFNYGPLGHSPSCHVQLAAPAAVATNEPCAMGRFSERFEFYQLLERNAVTPASTWAPSTLENCTYAFVASKYYLVGTLTLLSSLQRHSRHEGCEYVLLWHPLIPDSAFSEAEKDMVRCSSGSHHVRFVRVHDERAKLWSTFPVLKSIGRSALLKLEVFWLYSNAGINHNHTVIYMDADMMALQSISFVHQELRLPRASKGAWQLHASFPTYADGLSKWQNYSEHYLHSGFFAFQTPVPLAFQTQLLNICEHATRTQDYMLPVGGDQPVINQAIYDSPARLITHLDWLTNYRPLDSSEARWPWRMVHWSGCDKPWGAEAGFWNTSSALSELNSLWMLECRTLGSTTCMKDHTFACTV